MRINQYIAESGICSRREADRLIGEGRVTLNGVVAVLGSKVCEGDAVAVNGRAVVKEEERVCILVNKPCGITSTTDTAEKSNIIDFVGFPKRLFTIGRLDKDSEGAILLTNVGDYVNKLLRSEHGHEKVYYVRVNKPVTTAFLTGMSQGVDIYNPVLDKMVTTKPCRVLQSGARAFEITLTQGFNRQIRRMAEAFGYEVTYLKRTRFLFLTLKGLDTGEWRRLTADEMSRLDELCKASNVGQKSEEDDD